MKLIGLIFALLILPACGGFSLFKDSKIQARKTASIDSQISAADFETELKSLHHYYLLAQKNKHAPDDHKLIVIKAQIDEIETLLLTKKSLALKMAVSAFTQNSPVASQTLKSLSEKLGLKTSNVVGQVSEKSFEEAIKRAEVTKEFQILSMNIEHLSHMMNLKLKNTQPRKTSLDWMAQHPDKIIKRTKKLI